MALIDDFVKTYTNQVAIIQAQLARNAREATRLQEQLTEAQAKAIEAQTTADTLAKAQAAV
jgi:hypothetical protein